MCGVEYCGLLQGVAVFAEECIVLEGSYRCCSAAL